MKKDIFNDKILPECRGLVKFTLIFTPAVFILCGTIILLIAIFYDKGEYAARIFAYFLSIVAILGGITYPFITLRLIKIYPKHRKITKQFLQEYVFRSYDGSNEKGIYKD